MRCIDKAISPNVGVDIPLYPFQDGNGCAHELRRGWGPGLVLRAQLNRHPRQRQFELVVWRSRRRDLLNLVDHRKWHGETRCSLGICGLSCVRNVNYFTVLPRHIRKKSQVLRFRNKWGPPRRAPLAAVSGGFSPYEHPSRHFFFEHFFAVQPQYFS